MKKMFCDCCEEEILYANRVEIFDEFCNDSKFFELCDKCKNKVINLIKNKNTYKEETD